MITTKFRPRRTVIIAFGFALVAIAVGISGFMLAISGGVLGIFLLWSASALGILAGVLLLIGAFLKRNRRKLSITVGIAALIVLGSSLYMGVTFIRDQIRNPVQLLATGSNSQSFTATRIECQIGSVLCTLHDPHNQIRFRNGGLPASVNYKDGLRVVRFVDTDVSLHSLRNTIFIGSLGVQIGGWMGADFALESMAFTVDQNGNLQATNAITP